MMADDGGGAGSRVREAAQEGLRQTAGARPPDLGGEAAGVGRRGRGTLAGQACLLVLESWGKRRGGRD